MAAPTRVQSTGRIRATGATSVALTFATPPTAGNTVVVASIMFNNSGGTFSCADNRGNTYAPVNALHNGTVDIAMFAVTTALVTGSPFTVTITKSSGTSDWEACALEVTGAGGTGVLTVDRTATNSGTATTVTTGTTAAVTGADVFVVAGHAINVNQASITVQSVSPAWFEELENLSFSISVAGEIDSRSLTSVLGTTQSCSWTVATGSLFVAAVTAFKGVAVTSVETTRAYIWGPL